MTEEIKMTDMEKTIPTLSNGYSLGTPEQAKKICDIWGVDYEPLALEVVMKLEKNFWKGMNQLRKDAIGELGVPSLLLGHYIYISLATEEMLKKTKPIRSLFSTFYINGKGSWSRKVGQELEYMILNIDEIKKQKLKELKNLKISRFLYDYTWLRPDFYHIREMYELIWWQNHIGYDNEDRDVAYLELNPYLEAWDRRDGAKDFWSGKYNDKTNMDYLREIYSPKYTDDTGKLIFQPRDIVSEKIYNSVSHDDEKYDMTIDSVFDID